MLAPFVQVWHGSTLEPVGVLRVSSDVSSLVFVGAQLYVCCVDGAWSIVDTPHMSVVLACREPTDSSAVTSVLQLGTHVFVAFASGAVRCFDSVTRNCVRVLEPLCGAVTMLCAWRGALLGTCANGEFAEWDPATLRRVREVRAHDGGAVNGALVFGELLLTYGDDAVIRVWVSDPWEVRRELIGHTKRVVACVASHGAAEPNALARDERPLARVYSASADRTIRVWDPVAGVCTHVLAGHAYGVRTLAYAPASQKLLSASDDLCVRVWERAPLQCVHTLEAHQRAVRCVASAGDFVVTSGDDCTLVVWDLHTLELKYYLPGHTGSVYALLFSPDRALLFSASYDRTVRVWDTFSFASVAVLSGPKRGVRSLALTPDGATLVGGCQDGSVWTWSARSFARAATVQAHSSAVQAVFVLASGDVLTVSFGGCAEQWRSGTLELVRKRRLGRFTVECAAIDEARGRLVIGASDGVHLAALNTLAVERSVAFRRGCHAVLVRGSWLFCGAESSLLRVFSYPGLQLTHSFSQHTETVTALAALGRTIVSTSLDRRVKVWQ